MRASVLVAAHNEGDSLWKTIRSCVEGCAGLDYEIVVADDASTDGSVRSAQQRYPQIRVAGNERRQGASPTKHLAAMQARGDVLVFLDGHCNPEPGAIRRLVEDVEELEGQAIVTPRIPALTKCWTNKSTQVGHGYRLGLETFDCSWLPLEKLRVRRQGNRKFYESPALIGCALAIARELYDELHGFDPHMFYWGVEDLDFGLRSWLLGHPILHDPEAAVGHRFRQSFDNYDVPFDHLVVNQLRMARKCFTQSVWSEWLERCRQRSPQVLHDHPEGFWARAWELFQEHRSSAESERAYLHARRERDEFWYAERFDLSWPKLAAAAAPRDHAFADQPSASPSPAPSPSPPPDCEDCQIKWANGFDITNLSRNVLPGAQINLKLFCEAGTPTNIHWDVPGSVFKSYVVPEGPADNQATATLTRLAGADMSRVSVQFYWADVGDGRHVSVRFTLDGQQCMKQVTFNVKNPTVEFFDDDDTPGIGSLEVQPAPFPDYIMLLTPGAVAGTFDAGISFTASVSRPPGLGFSPAQWGFGQLIENTWLWKSAATGKCAQRDSLAHLGPQGFYVNDGPWLYSKGSLPSGPPYDDGDDFYTVTDSPGSLLSGQSQVVFANEWIMYIMFKPAPDPPGAGLSAWVPLRSLKWHANWCAQIINGAWMIVTQSVGVTPWFEDDDPPTWTGSLGTEPRNETDCPGDCK